MNPNVIRVEDLEFADYVIASLTVGNRLTASAEGCHDATSKPDRDPAKSHHGGTS